MDIYNLQKRIKGFIPGNKRPRSVRLAFENHKNEIIALHIHMFEFFHGVPDRINTDNFKPAVIKPELYGPGLNLAYQEMAKCYGGFFDPARLYHPKDRAKVERALAPIREFFRKLKALDPPLRLSQANLQAGKWSLQVSGSIYPIRKEILQHP